MPKILQMPGTTQSDESVRQAALNTRASFIVEAPAGSGKTGLLMQRFLKLLAEGEIDQPEEVLAITFTRKATAELRSRILYELESAYAETEVPADNPFAQATRQLAQEALIRDRDLDWQILQNPSRLRIRTIDSVCTEIAASLPLLAGGAAGRQPVEDAHPLYALAARRTLMHLGGPDKTLHEALRTVLLHRDASLADVESLLARMLATREQWAELVPLDRDSLTEETLETVVKPRLEKTLENIVCAGLTRAVNALPAPALHELTQLAHTLSLEPGYNGADSPIAFCANLHLPPEARAEHLDHWIALVHLILTRDGSWRKSFNVNHIGFTVSKPHKSQLLTLITNHSTDDLRETLHTLRDLPPARYPDDQWHIAKALFHLLLHALAELKVIFAEAGQCDFTEFSLAAREALQSEAGPTDLAASTGSTLRHLLVDEMQDTSSSQYDLIHLLTRSWDGHGQTLFLVGDPKQSIYLFRQARVERFLRTLRESRLGDVPIQPLHLNSNFRSQASLVEQFNEDFSLIFPSTLNATSGEAIDVPFVAAHPTRDTTEPTSLHWHATILDPLNPTRKPYPQQEAEDIREQIQHWLAKPLPAGRAAPWKIAVLARARKHLALILAELRRANIPYRAVKVEALNERPEVLDLVSLTRALLHPADRTAWLAVLHAPWCGLGLADLLTLTGEALPYTAQQTIATLIETRASLLPSEAQTLLSRAWPTLQAALHQISRNSLTSLVERTWRTLGGDAPLTPDQLTNTTTFFTLLRDLEQPGGWVDLPELDSRLTQLFAESSAAPGAVDLMTIHSAKGLEWDVVLIPALERRGQASRSDLLNWLELDAGDSSVILAPIASKGSDPAPLYRWLNKVRGDREKAERKRLYYVACTRAREALHLFAALKLNPATGELANPAHDSLLESAWPVAAPHFAAQLSTLNPSLQQSLAALELASEPAAEPLALAASAPSYPLLERLPLTFDPRQRFAQAAAHPLPYTPSSSLQQSPAFDRPEGSFAVRAFGNVVHRFLQVLSNRLLATAPDTLLAELPTWEPRLLASLRAEGLPPATAKSDAARALLALTNTLADPTGRWLLSPQPSATNELALTGASSLRVDRTFLAQATPLASGSSHRWIVDFKTTALNHRNLTTFAAAEQAKYSPQLQAYANAANSLASSSQPLILALYYPLIPHLIYWPESPSALPPKP